MPGLNQRRSKVGRILRTGSVVKAFQQLSTQNKAISASLQQLWERPDIRAQLWAVHSRPLYWSRQDRYLQTPDTLVLLPESTGRRLLGIVLGSSANAGLTALEIALLHRACQHLSRHIGLPLGQSSGQLEAPAWLTYWLLTSHDGYLGQCCIVWPKALSRQLPLPEGAAFVDKATLPWFKAVKVSVRIQAGQARLPLASLPLLEPGDLLVLDRSQTDQLVVITPEGPLRFATAMSQHVPHYPAMAADAPAPDWNHLMVDLTAEFEPFSLSLGDVRAMSEGLLVELDDLAHNTLTIHSQGTPIARGQLVVVGDRFAVRIEQVLAQPMEAANTSDAGADATAPHTHVEDAEADDDPLSAAFDDEEEQDEW